MHNIINVLKRRDVALLRLYIYLGCNIRRNLRPEYIRDAMNYISTYYECYTIPCANMASATFTKPATLAPFS